MKISVIIPVYNGEAYLRVCLDSILKSPYQEMEVIVVDDGSEDSSWEIIEEYRAHDPRIISVTGKNAGVSAARNRGLDMAEGEYIFFADCDDIIYEKSVRKLYRTACETGADLVIGNYRYLHDYSGELERPSQWIGNRTLIGDARLGCVHLSCILSNKLWKREILEKHHLRFEPLRMGEDLNFFLKYLALSNKVVTVKECIYDYRLHEGSASYSYSLKDLDFLKALDGVEMFYKQMGGMEAFIRELKYDRIFFYLSVAKRLPRFADRSVRKKLMGEYIRAEEQMDYTDVKDRKDIMDLVRAFRFRKRFRRIFESNGYAYAYQTGRQWKHKIKKVLVKRKGSQIKAADNR